MIRFKNRQHDFKNKALKKDLEDSEDTPLLKINKMKKMRIKEKLIWCMKVILTVFVLSYFVLVCLPFIYHQIVKFEFH